MRGRGVCPPAVKKKIKKINWEIWINLGTLAKVQDCYHDNAKSTTRWRSNSYPFLHKYENGTHYFSVADEHKYRSKYSFEEHVSAKSVCNLVIAFCKDFKAGSKFLEFCWIEWPWLLQISWTKQKHNYIKILLYINSFKILNDEVTNQTWHHRRINSRWEQLSKRSANASISLCKYLKGIEEATAGRSTGLTEIMHFLIRLSSFKRRLRASALLGWPLVSAASTACITIMDKYTKN